MKNLTLVSLGFLVSATAFCQEPVFQTEHEQDPVLYAQTVEIEHSPASGQILSVKRRGDPVPVFAAHPYKDALIRMFYSAGYEALTNGRLTVGVMLSEELFNPSNEFDGYGDLSTIRSGVILEAGLGANAGTVSIGYAWGSAPRTDWFRIPQQITVKAAWLQAWQDLKERPEFVGRGEAFAGIQADLSILIFRFSAGVYGKVKNGIEVGGTSKGLGDDIKANFGMSYSFF